MSGLHMIHEPFSDFLMPLKSVLIDRRGGKWRLTDRDSAGAGIWRQRGGKSLTVEEMFDENLAPLAWLLPPTADRTAESIDNEEKYQ